MVLAFNNLARLYIQPLIQECQYFLEVLEIIFFIKGILIVVMITT